MQELFVGPAIIVDDEVDRDDTRAKGMVHYLESLGYPVLCRTEIPAPNEILHWRSMSLIILDWDLLGKHHDTDVDQGIEASELPLGIDIPQAVSEDPRFDARALVHTLMNELYCPVFIVSNVAESDIWKSLIGEFDSQQEAQLRARVMVRAKRDAEANLLSDLEQWIRRHPAVYALKIWEQAYEKARTSLFQDFQRSSVAWPGILWQTCSDDSVNFDFSLSDTILRNLQHRLEPSLFDPDIILSGIEDGDLESMRRVLHQQAVLPKQRLHVDVIMPGDFFFDGDSAVDSNGHAQLPCSIDICLTPACDLVLRESNDKNPRMLMVEAALVEDSERSTSKALAKTLRDDDSATALLLHHIVPDDAIYRVRFKNWFVTEWHSQRDRRQGRLLDPYVTLLQQRFVQFSQRQGLPRLPDNFYMPLSS
ncbi:MAG: hypothetical protein OXF61_00805 [Acidimicrobiaceae bacterium]|nr:hypothetical protein [Acidimicrobiaceae bacterium]